MTRRILLVLATASLLAACGGSGNSDHASMDHDQPSATTQPPARTTPRVINVTANDQLRFEPASLSVKRGETVAFRLTNVGKVVHEFVIGDQAFQDRHEKEMAEMAGQDMPMADDAHGVSLPAGATKTFSYTFKQAGTLWYACHTAGHYPAWMKGRIAVG